MSRKSRLLLPGYLRAAGRTKRIWWLGAALFFVVIVTIEALRPVTDHLELADSSTARSEAVQAGSSDRDAEVQLSVRQQPEPGIWREITLRGADGRVVNSVRLPGPPQRIVSQTAASDDLLLELAPASRIAALSSYSAAPASSLDLDKALQVGHFVTNNAERILALEPDLVITAVYSAPELLQHLFATETPVLQLQEFSGWRDIRSNIEIIGLAMGLEDEATRLISESNSRLAAVGERRARAPSVRALAYTYGNAQARGSTFDEVLRWCSARNVASEAGLEGWTAVDLERIAAWRPDIVFLSAATGEEEITRRRFLEQPVLQSTRLHEPGRVVVVSGALFGTVSHRYVELVETVAAALDVIAPPGGGDADDVDVDSSNSSRSPGDRP